MPPARQLDVPRQRLQMRSPDHSLWNGWPQPRHVRSRAPSLARRVLGSSLDSSGVVDSLTAASRTAEYTKKKAAGCPAAKLCGHVVRR